MPSSRWNRARCCPRTRASRSCAPSSTTLDAQIKASAERVGRTLENEGRIAGARVESLQAAVDGQQDVVVKGNSSEIQLRALERDAKSQRDQLESYLTRFREASARDAESATPADARIVSRAVTPEIPSFPKKIPIVGFATLITLMLAVGGVLAGALLSDGGGAVAKPRAEPDADATRERREPAMEREHFAFPEAMPLDRWPEPASAPDPVAAATLARPLPASSLPANPLPASPLPAAAQAPKPVGFDLGPLIARLSSGGRIHAATVGRTVLVMETQAPHGGPSLPDGLAQALARGASVLAVDLNGPVDGPDDLGFSDLLAGEAAFIDVIQAERDTGMHRIGAGQIDSEILFEEPQALALTFEAMTEAYDWIVCRLRAGHDSVDLLGQIAAHMDGVIIASNAAAEDPDLADLYGIAADAGAQTILIAQDRPAEQVAAAGRVSGLRLSAA